MVEKNLKTGRYQIGPHLYVLGSLYLATTDIFTAAEPVVQKLNELTGEAVYMSVFDKGNVILVMKYESKHTFRLADHIGSILPAHASAMGKAFLSDLTEAQLDQLYPDEMLRRTTDKTITTKAALKRELAEIRRTGISFDLEGSKEGVEGIASLIRDASGKAVAALAIPVPLFRLNEGYHERLATLVRMGTNLISYRLGYQNVANPIRDVTEIVSWWQEKHK